MHFISKTQWRMFTYQDLHDLHVYSGWTVLITSLAHVAFHVARYASKDNFRWLWTHFSGASGLIATATLLLVAVPMTSWFKSYLSFEIRKGLHYLLIVCCLAMLFHAPMSAFPNAGGATWGDCRRGGVMDSRHCLLQSYDDGKDRIDHLSRRPHRRAIDHAGVGTVPTDGRERWVLLPELSLVESEACLENPASPAERQIFMENVGDWTDKLHRTLQRDTSQPIWVQGPFPLPYDHADEYDNQISGRRRHWHHARLVRDARPHYKKSWVDDRRGRPRSCRPWLPSSRGRRSALERSVSATDYSKTGQKERLFTATFGRRPLQTKHRASKVKGKVSDDLGQGNLCEMGRRTVATATVGLSWR
jgi:hypothetical protein